MLRWILPAAVAGIAAIVFALPLAWVAPRFVPADVKTAAPNLTFSGTVWNGHISGIPFFDSANFDLAPLAGQADITAGNRRNYLSGRIGRSMAEDLSLRADLASFPSNDGRLQGLRGELVIRISEIKFTEAGCESATGSARTDVLQRNGGSIQWTGPGLEGPIRCEAGAVIADLSGEDAQQSITALIRLSPDGTYRADVTARTDRVEADAVLPLFGFSRSGRDFKLTEQGRWR
jgi:hypothetical protein